LGVFETHCIIAAKTTRAFIATRILDNRKLRRCWGVVAGGHMTP